LQRENLRTYDCVREAVGANRLALHAWLYDLHSGDLLAYDDEAGEWGLLVLPEEGS
jgi:carbonic anhydrase